MLSIHGTSAKVGLCRSPDFKTDLPQQHNFAALVPVNDQSLLVFGSNPLLIFNGREHGDKFVTALFHVLAAIIIESDARKALKR